MSKTPPLHRIPRKARLVYLIGQLGLGGSERQLYLLLKHLDKTRFDCTVIVFNPSPHLTLNEALEKAGVHVISMPPELRSIPRRANNLLKTLRRLAPDILHSWTVHDNAYAGVVGRLAGAPIRLGAARGSLKMRGFQELSPLQQFLALRSVQGLLVNSQSIRQELVERGVAPRHVFFLPNCVETETNRSLPPELSAWGIQDSDHLVVLIANLRRVKNPLLFIEGMASVLPDFPNLHGLIVGQSLPSDPALPQQLTARIQQLGMANRLHLVGFRADIPALMKRLSILCLTSDHEGTPNVILEAMAAARPVVATRVGGVPEIVRHGITGLLIEPGDPQGLAQALRFLLEHPQIAQEMGRAGRQRVEKEFTCPQIARQLAEWYSHLLVQKGLVADFPASVQL